MDTPKTDHAENLERFNRMKADMGWTWADIERITRRAHPRSNFSKKVPAWAMLAIEVFEQLTDQSVRASLTMVAKDEEEAIWLEEMITEIVAGTFNAVTTNEDLIEAARFVGRNRLSVTVSRERKTITIIKRKSE